MRNDPITSGKRMHKGNDYPVFKEKALAVADATVSFVGRKGGYGKVVELTLTNDGCKGDKVLYAHLSAPNVKVNEVVSRGQKIATTGNSGGRSTGFHLHLGHTQNGVPMDPSHAILPPTNIQYATKYDPKIAKQTGIGGGGLMDSTKKHKTPSTLDF